MFLICAENYKRIKISENGYTDKGARYKIAALKRDGESLRKDFIGFVDKTSLHRDRVQFVKLVNIVSIFNDKELIDVPRNYWALGIYRYNAFFLVLENNYPFYHPTDHDKHVQRYLNNVVRLMP